MKMMDMKMPRQEKKIEGMPMPAMEKDAYPYGLCIRLGTEEIKKLGIEGIDVDSEVELVAKGVIKSKNVTEQQKDGKRIDVEIQIQKVAIKGAKEEKKEEKPAKKGSMYSDLSGDIIS